MTLSVLVVDDNALMRNVTRRAASMSGLPIGSVVEAGDGKEALAVLEKGRVNLILLDINMPVMDGEDFLRAMRKDPRWSDIPVIVVSTESSITRIARLRGMGAGFIHKPFRPEEFVEAIRRLASLGHKDLDLPKEKPAATADINAEDANGLAF